MEILNSNEIPTWLQYPREYLRLLEQNKELKFIKYRPWYFLGSNLARLRNGEIQKRYPHRRLFAFAARFDRDELACWEDARPGQVIIIHDGANEKFLNRQEYPSFWDWFRAVIEEMIEGCS